MDVNEGHLCDIRIALGEDRNAPHGIAVQRTGAALLTWYEQRLQSARAQFTHLFMWKAPFAIPHNSASFEFACQLFGAIKHLFAVVDRRSRFQRVRPTWLLALILTV